MGYFFAKNTLFRVRRRNMVKTRPFSGVYGYPVFLSLFGDNRGLRFSVRRLRLAHFLYYGGKIMKKLLTLLLTAALVFSFAACSPAEKPEEDPPAKTEEKLENTENPDAPTEDPKKTEPEKTEPVSQNPTSSKTETVLQNPTSSKTEPASKNTAPAENGHTHSFSQATCTSPAKCSCGQTEGKALGHKWTAATCKTPKTCSVCGATEGNVGQHKYDGNGKCTVCGAFNYTVTGALKACMKQANGRNAGYFDVYRILDVRYVENARCICDTEKKDNYISVFIYFYWEKDGAYGWDLDVYDVHKSSGGYSPSFSNIDVLYTYNDNNEIVKVRTNDYSLYYDLNSLKKADLSKIL